MGGAFAVLVVPHFARRMRGRRIGGRGARLDPAVADSLLEAVLDLYSLYEVGCTISAALDLDEFLTRTLRRVADATRVESYALFVLDPERSSLGARAVGGWAADGLREMTLAPGEGLASHVVRTRAPEAHAGDWPLPWRDTPPTARSVLAVPLIGRDGVLGALLLYSASSSAFVRAEQRAYFAAMGRQLGIGLDNAVRHRRATEMSYQDPLTGLFNRRYLEETLETEVRQAVRYDLPLSLTMIDIDRFKAYNDAHGHGRGDEVLRIVAQRLLEHTRSADIVTRYGGEEFAVILPMTAKPHARLVAEKLRAAIAGVGTDAPGGPRAARVTISVGVATLPDDASAANGLLEAADAALYEAKARGRNRVAVSSPDTPA